LGRHVPDSRIAVLAGDATVIGRRLARRLEDLEFCLSPTVVEPMVIRMDFVDAAGTVVGHQDFTINLPLSRSDGPHSRPRR